MSNHNIPSVSETKKSFLLRKNSGELDVFEAARYFSGANDNFIGNHNRSNISENKKSSFTQKYYTRQGVGRRMSLDMPNSRANSVPLQAMMMETPIAVKKKEKYKQPSSPGGKLAHFLNSLFNQTSSKKKKSKSTTSTQCMKDEDLESPISGWRRRRRSSISHFRSGSSNSIIATDTKSVYSTSTSSGFRTPPPYHIAVAQTPIKTTSYRDLRSYSDHKASESTKIPSTGTTNKNENYKLFKDGLSEKQRGLGFDHHHHDHHLKYDPAEEIINEFKRFYEDDGEDDGDSDSSSDLFELTNCDLGYYSSGLPVYETTHMDSIKRGAPISS